MAVRGSGRASIRDPLAAHHWAAAGQAPIGGEHQRLIGRRRRHGSGDQLPVVVIDAQHVDGSGNDFQVVAPDVAVQPGRGHVLEDVLRVLAAEDRIQEDPVERAVDAPCGIDVDLVGGVGRICDGEVQRDPQPVVLARHFPHGAGGQAVAQQQVVRRCHCLGRVGVPGGVLAAGMGQEGGAPRFVQRGPVRRRGPRGARTPPVRSRQSGRRCRGSPSRRAPAVPGAGPSGRA